MFLTRITTHSPLWKKAPPRHFGERPSQNQLLKTSIVNKRAVPIWHYIFAVFNIKISVTRRQLATPKKTT